MSEYKIYLIDRSGKIEKALDFEGQDDISALDRANEVRGAGAAEIWQRTRVVARLDSHGDATEAAS